MQTPPNRLLDIDLPTASAEYRAIAARVAHGRGRVPTPYKVWLHCAPIADGMETIGTHLSNRSSFSEAETEIVILSVAAFWQSLYVLQNHIRHSRRAGLSQAAIDSLCAGAMPHFEDPRWALVAQFTLVALRRESLDDAAFSAMDNAFGRRGIAELLMLIGYYSAVALAMKFHEVQPGST